MRKNRIQKMSKIFLIASSLFLFACEKNGGKIKIYNVEAANPENSPGLIRRDKGGKIESVVTWHDADRAYGCMLWSDIEEIIDRVSLEVSSR